MKYLIRALLLLSAAGAAAQADTGVLWEFSGTMQIAGMRMPMAAVKVCTSPDRQVAPLDKSCEARELRHRGKKTVYRVVCAARGPLGGSGESELKGDALESVVHLKTARGEIVVSQTGKRLGSCTLPN